MKRAALAYVAAAVVLVMIAAIGYAATHPWVFTPTASDGVIGGAP